MTPKKPFVLRLNPDVQKAVERWAADEFRSLNGQIEYLLFQQLKENGRLPKPPAAEEKGGTENADS